MRLGGYYGAERVEDLEPLCAELDASALSAIPAPERLLDMPDDECVAFGEEARRLGLVVGEAGMWDNLMTSDNALRAERIERVRQTLRKADLMRCQVVVTLVGSSDPSDSPIAPHQYMFTDACRREFREIARRIVEGLELDHARYAIEPWCNCFFYEPDDVADFLDSVDDPRVHLHLDLVNMIGHRTFFATDSLAERTFGLLGSRVAGVHLKDIVWDPDHVMLRWDEAIVGDGAVDHHAVLRHVAELPPDTACFCEHLPSEADYRKSFERLHEYASATGVEFLPRTAG